MRLRFPPLPALMLTAAVALAACESSEERAERHFEAGVELLEEGDVTRALVEFRNVFKLNPTHKDALMAYARAQKDRGRLGDSYAKYLRVIEQYPDTLEARIELAEMSINSGNWDETRRHVEVAVEQAPNNLRVQVADSALRYAEAVREDDFAQADGIAEEAIETLKENPGNFIARRVVIDYLLRTERFEDALPIVEGGLERQPENYALHTTKLNIHLVLQNSEEIGNTLKTMVETFPEDETARQFLMAWFLEREDTDGAEAFLRDLAARPDAGDDEAMAVVQFLRSTKGDEAARAEVDRLVASKEDPARFIAVQASMDFDAGKQDEAMATLEALVDAVEEPDENTNNIKLVLARMQSQTGNLVGARARIEEIIEADNSHVEALKIRAAWLIEEDLTGDAIIDLRTALAQAPRDPDIMTLMASAHERAGERELAGERYSLAVEFSNQAPTESLRYASHLVSEDRLDAANAVLEEALANAPNNLDLLRTLGGLRMQAEDWNEVQRVIWRLRSLEDETAEQLANGLQAEMLLQQDRVDETVEYLENLAENDESLSTFAALIQTQVQAGNIETAVTQVEERLAADPTNGSLRNLRASLHLFTDERDQAEAIYRSLLKDFPGNEGILRTLYSILMAAERVDEARELIDEQIAATEGNPNALSPLLFKAEILERDRDFEGAIAIYEEMYEANSNNIIIANNLASLIATHRDTDDGLTRAYAVARRLRGIEIPALQDTYGWIEFRRGNYDEALVHLEPAAEGLPNDPLVQYHLARTYLALERPEDAKRQLERAVELAGENPLPQIVDAQKLLEELSTASGD